MFFQDQLIFHPSSRMIDSPERLGIHWSEHWIETEDDVRIHGWMIGDPEGQPVVVFSHGNAGNISGRVEIAGTIANQGSAVFLYDYRGYGRSEGSPDEDGIYKDGKAVILYLNEMLNIPIEQMVYFGRSLGGAVATRQAAECKGAGLVLDSAFLNGKKIATDIYPFIPGFLVRLEFPVDEDLRRSKTKKIMIMHAKNDRIIPFSHGEELYRIAQKKADNTSEFVELQGGHNTGFSQSKEIYIQSWSDFFLMIEENE